MMIIKKTLKALLKIAIGHPALDAGSRKSLENNRFPRSRE